MKKILSFGIIIVALTFSYIAYHKWVSVPKKLVAEYEQCKIDAQISNSMNWLRQCDNQKALSKECKQLLSDGFPWDLHRQIINESFELTNEDYEKYNNTLQQISSCSCETLPKKLADDINDDFKEAEDKCLSELETMNKVLN